MVFNSLEYGCFLPLVVLAHRFAPARWRAGLLVVASYVFYAAWNPLYLPLIVVLTGVNGLAGVTIERLQPRPGSARLVLAVSIAANLLVLGFYKYALFAVDSASRVLSLVRLQPELPHIPPTLPLGISFFTFEFIHYLIDVHRGGPAVRSPVKFALFASFFPTQVAGPIKRYQQFVPQIERPIPLDSTRLGQGLRLIVQGLFKKMALADNLGPIASIGFSHALPGGLAPLDAWLAAIAFAFQIYFDFSGYTDIGRGSAVLLGYEVPENFRRPYLATNVAEFWHRWHISLSTWLRDYLYIPLGGNRSHRHRNLILTMALGGLWHGASTTYIVWGLLHGAYLSVYWRLTPRRASALGRVPRWARSPALGWLSTFVLVCVGWVFFRATNTTHALVMVVSMLGVHADLPSVLLPTQRLFVVLVAAGTLVVELIIERRHPVGEPASWGYAPGWLPGFRPVGYLALFTLAVLLQPNEAPRFIYFQF